MKKIVIIGATSAIAAETARLFAAEGASLYLLGRNMEKLESLAADLKVRGASQVESRSFDGNDLTGHASALEVALQYLGEIDAALIAHGDLPDQAHCQSSVDATLRAMTVNYLSPVCLLTWLANYFEGRGTGNITVISSVAGDRGRQSNYIYGAAKGGLTRFLEGLRNRLAHHGVSVTTIKPGFVDTPMTANIKKGKLFAQPAAVGAQIHRAMKSGKNVVYSPSFWLPIMLIIQHIPECIFKKLKL